MVQGLWRLALAAVLGGVAGAGHAAEIMLSDGQSMGCQLRIDGPIATGDADRLDEALRDLPFPEGTSPVGQRVCLNSTGGSLVEAVRMGDLIAERFMGTAVPEAATCEGACALVFLGGGLPIRRRMAISSRTGCCIRAGLWVFTRPPW